MQTLVSFSDTSNPTNVLMATLPCPRPRPVLPTRAEPPRFGHVKRDRTEFGSRTTIANDLSFAVLARRLALSAGDAKDAPMWSMQNRLGEGNHVSGWQLSGDAPTFYMRFAYA